MTTHKSLVAYLIALHLLLGLVLVKSDFMQRIKRQLGLPPPELTEHYQAMVAYHRRMDVQVPEGAILFIGDSLIQSLYVANVTPVGVNYGIGSDTTIGVYQRLEIYRSLDRAKSVVLAIGVNDLKRRDVNDTLQNYRRILERLPRGLRLIISAPHPVDEKVWGDPGFNRRIKSLNRGLKRLAHENQHWAHCDIGDQLADETGNLKNTYHTGDGIHLNAAGYALWATALRGSLESLSGADLRTDNQSLP